MDYSKLDQTFEMLWNKPPSGFNPDYRPWAIEAGRLADEEIKKDPDYKIWTREERGLRRKPAVEKYRKILDDKYEKKYLETRDETYFPPEGK